jgi:hypothetical protein
VLGPGGGNEANTSCAVLLDECSQQKNKKAAHEGRREVLEPDGPRALRAGTDVLAQTVSLNPEGE